MYYAIIVFVIFAAAVAGFTAYEHASENGDSGASINGFFVFMVVAIVLGFLLDPLARNFKPESVSKQEARDALKNRDDAIMRMDNALKENDLDTARFWNEKAQKYNRQSGTEK